ncbi:DnaD domain protein [Cohnella sp. JJ-181]|uniref:DnaD domain protein n=1 Tax=Cohnella rhizoplanae TaxID=2974897 RepID=UPI0022FF5C0D|nr:DnaD domain protein [Cohnella sp. JJ-181]CAI6041153.1 Replication initiation and membrane attachment protein [Cohnella sp. JJ-181]
MRVSNKLEFTEHHRYTAWRNFSLCSLERRVLAELYQPMVGALSIGLYLLLYHHLGDDETGYSQPEAQRRLFLGLGLEPNAAGRQSLVESASKLEAVGLMQSFRQHDPAADETLYEYMLQRPLAPGEFFANLHLSLLLRDRIGKPALMELRESLAPRRPGGLARFLNREEITVPFYELFRINSSQVDPELEQSLSQTAPAREAVGSSQPDRVRHSELLLRFPRGSSNRTFVERLNRAPESMAQINFLAYKFDLELPEVSRLLDEDGVFLPDGTLHWDELQSRANLIYRQGRKRGEERERYLSRIGEPPAAGGPDEEAAAAAMDEALRAVPPFDVPDRLSQQIAQDEYGRLLMVEPYTRFLERFFPGSVPDVFARIFERIDMNYKLPEAVINVLIHYVLGTNHAQRLTASFIDSVAANMLAKGIDSYDKAVRYVREQEKLNETLERRRRGELDPAQAGKGKSGSGRSRAGASGARKPSMPVVEDKGPAKALSAEERQKLRDLARQLDKS